MIQNLLGNTSALRKKELEIKINQYGSKVNSLNKVNYLEQINNASKNKLNEIDNEKVEDNEETDDKNSKFKKIENNAESVENGGTEIKKEGKYNKFEGLNEDELKKMRDKLLVERNDTTNLYNKIPLKVNKIEQIKRRDELEKKLALINNDLMQIRLRLKGNI